jgi:rRNA pseudouridine-1189 N-methylase Emg1 (Nep1/Mra1 family)
MLLDSPLNKAGMLQIYIHTAKNVLIEVHPQCRIPRIYRRFCGLMGTCALAVMSRYMLVVVVSEADFSG